MTKNNEVHGTNKLGFFIDVFKRAWAVSFKHPFIGSYFIGTEEPWQRAIMFEEFDTAQKKAMRRIRGVEVAQRRNKDERGRFI